MAFTDALLTFRYSNCYHKTHLQPAQNGLDSCRIFLDCRITLAIAAITAGVSLNGYQSMFWSEQYYFNLKQYVPILLTLGVRKVGLFHGWTWQAQLISIPWYCFF
jgi:hypothetical protein